VLGFRNFLTDFEVLNGRGLMKTIANFNELLSRANNDLIELLLRAATDEKLRSECLADDFDGGWKRMWLEESDKSQSPPILPENTLSAFFGCALTVLKNRGNKMGVLNYLDILAAPPFKNFHASNLITAHCIRILRNEKENSNESPEELIRKAYECARMAAKHHYDTPGYLLSAHVSFCIAQCVEKRDRVRASVFHEVCYKDLLIARQLEPFCTEKIQSAYLGRGISASNQWGCNSIDEMLTRVLVYLPDSHFFHCKQRAEKEASKVATEIIELHYSALESHERMSTIQFF
jgi:hypothetical protein